MFGYVQSPGTPIGAFADLLASTLNANLTIWRSAPAPVELERLTIDWIRQILGFNPEAGGLFVSGGSMANLAALAAARQTKYDSLGRLRMYASSATHFSITKAAALLGIGRQNVQHVAVDERFRMRVDDLVAKITADLEAGFVPFCVVGNAGTVDTGAVDPLREIREVANRFQLWMHVDGSYGAFAILAESARKLFAGMEEADSIALDPHKWLYLPVDVGCVIYRNPEIARAAFAHEAEYTRMFGEEADEAFVCWDYGPELSRRFRALKVWMLLKGVGLDRLSDAIESNLACARHLESMVQASDDFEMVAPVELSIFCFRHVPAQLRNQPPEAIDAFNERLASRSATGRQFVSLERHARRSVRLARLCIELSDNFARHGDPARRFATRRKIPTDFCLSNRSGRRNRINLEAMKPGTSEIPALLLFSWLPDSNL